MKLAVLEPDRIAKIVDQNAEALDLLTVRFLMAPVQERDLLPVIILCDRLIRSQHAVLDQHRRRVPLIRPDLDRASLCVQDDLALREIKVDRTARHALFPQHTGRLIEKQEHRNEICIFFEALLCKFRFFLRFLFLRCIRLRFLSPILCLQDRIHRRVCHSAVDPDDRLTDLMSHDDPFFIDIHEAAHCQAVAARIQGTDPVGKPVRQHRDHTVHEIHARSALICLRIERRPLLHIVTHIRNMDSEMVDRLPVDRLLRHTDRIVEVFRVLAVDRHHRDISEIHSSVLPDLLRHIVCGEFLRRMGNFFHHVLRELLRKSVGTDDRQDIDSRVIDMSEDLLHMSLRILISGRICVQFHDYLVSGDSAVLFPLRDKDVHRDPWIVGDHKAKAFIFFKGTDQRLVGMF